MIKYRKARADDQKAIRSLIYRVKINPIGLDWQRFLVAVDEHDQVIGCGQIKPHGGGTREIASIAVMPEHQGQGIGKEMIRRLMENEPLPLYLTCRSVMGPYYQKFGFVKIPPHELKGYFRRIWGLARVVSRLFPGAGHMWVMVKEQD
jgi:N-acetylglutamate synthase-like GNAT family acetyltransferase